jgi:hypothetical protein
MDAVTTKRRELLKTAALGAVGLAAPGLPRTQQQAPVGQIPDEALIDAFEGRLAALTPTTVDLELTNGTKRLGLSPTSTFWRAGEVSADNLRLGDALLVRVRSGDVLRGWSNLTRLHGLVLRAAGLTFELQAADLHAHSTFTAKVSITPLTAFEDFYSGRALAPTPIRQGMAVDVVGMRTEGGVLATSIAIARPDAVPTTRPTPGPARTSRQTLGPLTLCTYQYYGYASYFDCPTGAGRCATCNTGSSTQLAWPALDYSCNCCSSSCCDCSNGCMNQEYASCGDGVTVVDSCNSRSRNFSIVDCGPCQRDSGCQYCSVDLCVRSCSDCYGRSTAVVDLTKPSFAVWYDPAYQQCFSCLAQITLPC